MNNHNGDDAGNISEKTRVPIGIAVATITAFVGGAIWLNNSLNRIENRLATLEVKVESGTADRWTARDMKIWVLQFRLDNPNIKVPESGK